MDFHKRFTWHYAFKEVSTFPEDLNGQILHRVAFNHVFGILASISFFLFPSTKEQICSLVLSRVFLPLKVLGGRGPTFYSIGYTKKFFQERWVSSKRKSLPSYLENKNVSITLHNEEYFIQTWAKSFGLIWDYKAALLFSSLLRSCKMQLYPQLYNAIFFLLSWSLPVRTKLRIELNCLLVLGTSWNFPQRYVALCINKCIKDTGYARGN